MSVRDAKEIRELLAYWERRARTKGEPVHGQTYLAARLAIRLEDLRDQQGLTMQELADRVGTSRAHISRLLSGRYAGISLSSLVRLAQALGCEVDIRVRPLRPAGSKSGVAARRRRQVAASVG